MGGLLGAFILTVAVVLAMALGILLAYAAVIGILHSFAARPQLEAGNRVLVPAQTRAAHAGGD